MGYCQMGHFGCLLFDCRVCWNGIIIYGLAINVFLILSVQYQCFVAESNVSVERLEQYMHIPSEAPEAIETNRPLHNWPSVGEVEIRNLKVDFTISQIYRS